MSMVLVQKAITVDLSWNPNTEPDLAGYHIYADPTSPPTTKRKTVGITTTTSVDVPEHGYYFGVTAYDVEGNESEISSITQDV